MSKCMSVFKAFKVQLNANVARIMETMTPLLKCRAGQIRNLCMTATVMSLSFIILSTGSLASF